MGPLDGGRRYLHYLHHSFSSVQFSHSVMSDSLQPHGLRHARPPCPSPTPRVHLNPCPFTWGQTIIRLIKIMVTSFKRSHARTATLTAPNPAAGHHQPTPLLETPGYSRASLGQTLVGSLLLFPVSCCVWGSVCALQESICQSCVSSGSSMVGLMATSSKRAYAIPKSAAPRAAVPVGVPC